MQTLAAAGSIDRPHLTNLFSQSILLCDRRRLPVCSRRFLQHPTPNPSPEWAGDFILVFSC